MTPATRAARWYSGYIFDLDGTVYLGDALLPGVAEALAAIRDRGARVRFLSNNPTRTPAQYVDKLGALGIDVAADEVVNTITTTVGWLREHHPDAVVYPIAEEPLHQALADAGIATSTDPARIDIVIASYDRGFDYAKLQIAFDAIWFHRRAILIQTNPDRYCPYPGGRGEPDAAAITAAIEACTQTRCAASMGKPSPLMAREATRDWNLPVGDVVMVGDRLATDITMALDAGLASALVLTGDSTAADVAATPTDKRPTHVLATLTDLLADQST